MKKLAVFFLIMGIWMSQLCAADALIVSDLGTSAQMIGAGHIQGFDKTAATVFENPAGLYRVKRVSIFNFFSNTMGDQVSFYHGGVAVETPYGNVGAAMFQAKVPNVDYTGLDGLGQPTSLGTFDYTNTIYKFAYGYSLTPYAHVGVAYSYYSSKSYQLNASGYNTDLGAIVDVEPFQFSVVGKNVLPASNLRYSDGQIETLPTQWVMGAKYTFDNLAFLGQVANQTGVGLLKSAGVQYQPDGVDSLMIFSAGYSEFYTGTSAKSRVSVGVGLQFSSVQVHVAFEKSDYALQDNLYFMSLNMNL
jgi:hypothetical protein